MENVKNVKNVIDWATWEDKETGKKYVSSIWYDIECNLLNEKLNTILGEYRNSILLQDDSDFLLNDNNTIQMEVNWCAMGKCSIEETRKFIELLEEAIKLAESFKYNGYHLKYSVGIKTKEEGEALVRYYNKNSMYCMLTLKKDGEYYICIRSEKES